ncbi:MAG TPA: amino acid permease [Vicinamibacteria bacterium]|nr:amino acid permease [Vicinamibacteria bacterium]
MSATAPGADGRGDGPGTRPLGFWMATALVVGNIIGSGVYLLPASLAPYGRNGLVAWLFTATGAVLLAVVFAALSRAFPKDGGPYVYTRAAFGELAGFVVAWGYWVSVWVGNAAIATGAVSYTSAFAPWIASVPGASAVVTIAVVWLLTFVNCWGVRTAGWVQAVTTVLKLMPLLAVALVGGFFLRRETLAVFAEVPITLDGTTAAATLTLWALLGLESATVPADKVRDPARTIPRATLVGTVVAAALCSVACSLVLLLLPASELAASNAPFAEAARVFWGEGASMVVALFAAISAYGALNGWILLQGELPFAMARDGVFPRAFARESARRTPVFALVSTSVLVTLLVLANFHGSVVQVFTFMILLATSANLVAYLACSLALLVLLWRGRLAGSRRGTAWLAAAGALGAGYSLWAVAGAGKDATRWGAVLLLAALPVYALMKRASHVREG